MRFALPNARIMVHQPSGGFQGQASDIERHAEDIIKMKRRLNEIYVKHTGQTYEEIENDARPRPLHDRRGGQGLRPDRQGDFDARAALDVELTQELAAERSAASRISAHGVPSEPAA